MGASCAEGSRVRSLRTYQSGVFSVRMKCAFGDTSGMDQDFYVSSDEKADGSKGGMAQELTLRIVLYH